MLSFLRRFMDPDQEGRSGGGNQVEPVPPGELPNNPQPAIMPSGDDVVPKTKEEWDRLAQDNPQRWINLTQTRMDQTIRQSRETAERLRRAEEQNRNLAVELENFRKGNQDLPPQETSDNKTFSKTNMPKNDSEWEQLWLENPNLASDLRNYQYDMQRRTEQQQQARQTEFSEARKQCVLTMVDRHPDMYVQELDDSGNPRIDNNGKPVFKINPQTGLPQVNTESEKFKVFEKVFNEDSDGYGSAKFGPRLAMVEMERRLQEQGNQQIQNTGQGDQKQGSEASQPDQRGTIPGGVNPPANVKVSFSSDEEKEHAKRAVERGIYKNIEEYCQLRDGKQAGITDENRFPKFN